MGSQFTSTHVKFAWNGTYKHTCLCVLGSGNIVVVHCTQIVGIGFGAVMTISRTWNNAEEQIYDRAYRLRYNKGQVRLDKFSYGGALIGGICGAAGFPTGGVLGAMQGASMGLGAAVLAHAFTKPKSKEKKESNTNTESKN